MWDEKEEEIMKKNWKKTLAAAGMGMVLMTVSLTSTTAFGAVDTQNLLTFVNDTMDDGSQVYYFEEVAVTLQQTGRER